MNDRPVLSASGLSRCFGDTVAVEDAGLELAPGELVLLLGRSGAGKTTLLGLLSGLDQPDTGRVEIAGQDLALMDGQARGRLLRENLGWIFQAPGLLDYLTAVENVALSLELLEVPPAQALGRARQMLAAVGLARRCDHLPGELSGGERQRVAIARAMVKEPRVVFCDEPTGQLDTQVGASVLSLLRQAADRGVAMLVATHDQDAVSVADRILLMEDGKLSLPLA